MLLRFFRSVVRRYFRRHFRAVRMSFASTPEAVRGVTGPLILVGNHSSWWDPMVAFLLAEVQFPNRAHYAPMDAAALERYRILERLGVFPVELESARGAAQFLRTGAAVLASRGVLWVTPQGRFTDVRERPLVFKPGLATLAVRAAVEHGSCTILPLAIEYTFWNERLPECLLRLGQPVTVRPDQSPSTVEAEASTALTTEMDTLAELAIARDPSSFETILTGSRGTGGVYAGGKRLKAALLRQPYTPDHTPTPDEAGGRRTAVLRSERLSATAEQPSPVPTQLSAINTQTHTH